MQVGHHRLIPYLSAVALDLDESEKVVLGKSNYEQSANFVSDRFLAMSPGHNTPGEEAKPIYTHFTNATDTRNIDRVFESCIDVVFKVSMEKVGFM